MNLETLVFAPVMLPLLGAALVFCAKAFLQGRSCRVLEYGGVFMGLGLPWLFLALLLPEVFEGRAVQGIIGSWNPAVGIPYRFDGLAWLVHVLGFSVAGAAWVYSLGAGPRGPAFSAVFLIQTAALAATMITADLFNLFVCLEVLGIASYVLVAASDKPGAALASFSYLMLSATAMVFFLLGVYGLYRLTGALSYGGIARGLRALPAGGGAVAQVSLALVVSAVAIRVAVMPLYGWLPDAHALAPHAISAVLSGVLIKTPLFALSRVLLILPSGAAAGQLLGYAGAATALAAVVIALSQTDAKRLLAYHSVSQIGYVVCAWGAALHVGLSTGAGIVLMGAAFLHAFYHALFKGLLFLSVGTTIDQTGERNVYELRGAAATLRARGEKFPVTLVCFAIGALAICAIPPFNGYASKTALSLALKGSVQEILLTAAGVGTVASFLKLSRIYWPRKSISRTAAPSGGDSVPGGTGSPDPRGNAAPWSVHGSQIVLAILCLLGGVAAPAIYAGVLRLLAVGPAAPEPSPAFFAPRPLAKTAFVALGGTALFFLAVSEKGSRALRIVRERPRSFQGLFVSFALGTAALAAWLLRRG